MIKNCSDASFAPHMVVASVNRVQIHKISQQDLPSHRTGVQCSVRAYACRSCVSTSLVDASLLALRDISAYIGVAHRGRAHPELEISISERCSMRARSY